ncbi:glycosyl transferase family 2 (plasmid) [Dinoroseobacter shibae DFL 12 = DSM 16493]|jgi:GT2 family glycosyltransferase|uniref:Glycosyl transferase family 2 n=1 Tax=Dinoroseobacter shibae (strain DSM 16493 / NCIMB 14021 / DFL 12) TaxID=398580 RepID=A8LUD7_DINSH|nr:glycosyltransferase family 2 protein [Dinoroseobacter shibae]ABV95854.1 glycosyl transferase family 2 [Dinoroseobacter shibae DFL 12 = DSM 16493]URF49098.1 glycosyltransferase [Dinoroseobacter shibae]URF53407.1 glycosyltransferase [Dinoroseobacter shibae]
MARIALIIPHYNDTARLATCLGALAPQMTEAVELIVVDNGSTEDLGPIEALLQGRFPGARLIHEPGKGAAFARNRGVAETTAPDLLFLDADCVPGPDWLTTALSLAGRDRVVGGRVDVFDETPPPRSGPEAFETVFAFHQKTYVEGKGFSVTANLLTSRTVFDRTGPFINALSEDLDWCRRAVATGAPLVYEDALAVAHPTRQDWPALRKKWLRLTEEGFATHGTNLPARASWALRAGAVLVSGPAHLPKVLHHDALSAVEKRRGAVTLLRLRGSRAVWMLRQALRGASKM